MRGSVRRWGWIAALALIVASLGWYFGSPWWTLWQMKNAAEARDVRALSEHVDFPALRRSAATQMRVRIDASRISDDPALSAIAGAIGERLADSMSDAAVSPEGLRMIFSAGAVAAPAGSPLRLRVADMEMRRDGFDQFRMVGKRDQGAELIFRRYGLAWKLSGIEFPNR